MNGTILPFTVELDNGPLSGPAWSLDVAVQAPREAEGAGRTARDHPRDAGCP
jgi:hypothetical protein